MEISARTARQWARLGPRGVFGQAVLSIAENCPDLMVMSADLGSSSGLERFRQSYPDRFLNTGIAEQNLIGVAGGMAKEGYNVFATSFSPFIAMRASDQVRMNLGYMQLNVKAVAIGSGIGMGFLGNSHFGIEDAAVMRSIPNMTVVCPADCSEIVKTVQAAANFTGPMYIRLTGAPNMAAVYNDDYDFEFGKAITLREGKDVGIIACGAMVGQSMKAADMLAENGIEATVLNMHTIKPLDKAALSKLATTVPRIVTVEEHSVIGGLGSAVAEYFAPHGQRPAHKLIGIQDKYIKTGEYGYMLEQEKLDATSLCETISAFLES
ncbi:MAG: transketolase [Methylocystaceae bacterium]|nr:transketolase [Methylocystaceae bacterium]